MILRDMAYGNHIALGPSAMGKKCKAVVEVVDEVVGGAMRGLTGIGEGWNLNRLNTFLGTGGDTNLFSSEIDSDGKADRATAEREMTEVFDQMSYDPETGLPIFAGLAEEVEKAKEIKEGELGSMKIGAEDIKEAEAKKLYEMGVMEHGATTAKMKDTSQEFQKNIGDVMFDFAETTGGVEEQAKANLDILGSKIDRVESLHLTQGGEAASGDAYFEGKTFETGLNPATEPLVEEDDAHDFDYTTGRKKKS
tara:strand:- start:5308 stop:6060 length:753 start_codon:yes stop_codon:yes gene_type:complete